MVGPNKDVMIQEIKLPESLAIFRDASVLDGTVKVCSQQV